MASSLKYLGIQISSDLTGNNNTTTILKKAHQRLYFLRRLKKAGLSPAVLTSFCSLVWELLSAEEAALQRVIKSAQKITNCS